MKNFFFKKGKKKKIRMIEGDRRRKRGDKYPHKKRTKKIKETKKINKRMNKGGRGRGGGKIPRNYK